MSITKLLDPFQNLRVHIAHFAVTVVIAFAGLKCDPPRAIQGTDTKSISNSSMRNAIINNRFEEAKSIIASDPGSWSSILVNGKEVSTVAYALSYGAVETVRTMLRAGVQPKGTWNLRGVLAHALALDDPDLIKELVVAGAKWSEEDEWKRQVAHVAAMSGSMICLRTLAELTPAESPRDVYGRTPFHYAAILDRAPVIQLLLDRVEGVSDLHYESDGAGLTALHFSILVGSKSATDSIIHNIDRLNANQRFEIVNLRSKSGRTPLHLAARRGWMDTIESLRLLGSDVSAKDNRGWTPLEYLRSGNFAPNSEMLEHAVLPAEFDQKRVSVFSSSRPALSSINLDRLQSDSGGLGFMSFALRADCVEWAPSIGNIESKSISSDDKRYVESALKDELTESGLAIRSPFTRVIALSNHGQISIKLDGKSRGFPVNWKITSDVGPDNFLDADLRVAWAVLRHLIIEIPSVIQLRLAK